MIAGRFSPMGGIPDRVFKATFAVTGGTPLSINTGGYSFKTPVEVDWGDGTVQTCPAGVVMASIDHQYAVEGEYQVTLKSGLGLAPFVSFKNNTQIKSVDYSEVKWFRGDNEQGDFRELFRASGVITVAGNLFKYNNNATDFRQIFYNASSLISVPEDIFKSNAVASNFTTTFYYCRGLISIPSGLFKYNINASTFNGCFNSCNAIQEIPAGIFANNTSATTFTDVFRGCSSARLNSRIFSAIGDKGNRFANVTPTFSNAFSRSSYSGSVAGTAPDLWNYTFNGTPTTTGCFGGNGNSATSLTNYADIPEDWK